MKIGIKTINRQKAASKIYENSFPGRLSSAGHPESLDSQEAEEAVNILDKLLGINILNASNQQCTRGRF
jgi:hypothetical protein